MKAIIIEESNFEREFQTTVDKLKLGRFMKPSGIIRKSGEFENSEVGELHRSFHYELYQLRDRLLKSNI